jgi:hypothetical protein
MTTTKPSDDQLKLTESCSSDCQQHSIIRSCHCGDDASKPRCEKSHHPESIVDSMLIKSWISIVAIASSCAIYYLFMQDGQQQPWIINNTVNIHRNALSNRHLLDTDDYNPTLPPPHEGVHKPVFNEDHEPLFPLSNSDYYGLFLSIIGLVIAAGGGIGGGKFVDVVVVLFFRIRIVDVLFLIVSWITILQPLSYHSSLYHHQIHYYTFLGSCIRTHILTFCHF